MKKLLPLFLLLFVSCVETKVPEPTASLEEFLLLKNKVDELADTVSVVRGLAGAFGRELLEFHLPECMFVQREDSPLMFWVARTCDEIYKIKPDLIGARSITVRVYRSDNHTEWFWKFESIEY